MDRCNREILETVAHQPRYKSEIYRTIDRDTSTGAISRRVDTLVEDGYLSTTPVSPQHFNAGFLYILHRWDPIVTEALSLILPFVVLGNVLTVVGEGPHLAVFGMTLGVVAGYVGISIYCHWQRAGSLLAYFRVDLEPLFWQPSS